MAKKGDRATHCKHGHAFTPANVYIIDRGIQRALEYLTRPWLTEVV